MKRLKKRLLFLALALALCVAGVWLLRPAYRRFREHRSLDQARNFAQQHDVRNAVLALRQTLGYNPTNLEALTLMADQASSANSPATLALRSRIEELSPTLDNKLMLVSTSLRFEQSPFPIAAETLQELQSTATTNVQYHQLASQLALRTGRLADARAHLQKAAQLDPTNQMHQMNLAVLDLGSTDSSRVEAARKRLESMAHDPVVGPLALRSLVEHSLATYQFDEAKRFSDELLATPHVQFKDKLQHLTVLRALHSDNSDSWLATVKVEATTNSTSAAQTLEWLLKRGEAAQAMEWLQSLPEEIQSGQPMPLIGADCFAAVKDWHGLDARLGKEQWEELEFLRHAWLARAFREQKQHEIADLHWKSARALAEKRVEAFTALARLVASWGWKKETDEVLQAIVQRYPRQEWAWQELIRTRMAAGDTAGLYRTYKALLEQNTNSLAAKNNVAALGLLLKQDTDAAIERAQEVYEADTNNPVFVSTEAFALHEKGRTSEGLQLMEALPSKALQRPEIALYYVVLLSAAGERERAKPYYIFAEKADLLPEEQRLLDDSRKPR